MFDKVARRPTVMSLTTVRISSTVYAFATSVGMSLPLKLPRPGPLRQNCLVPNVEFQKLLKKACGCVGLEYWFLFYGLCTLISINFIINGVQNVL